MTWTDTDGRKRKKAPVDLTAPLQVIINESILNQFIPTPQVHEVLPHLQLRQQDHRAADFEVRQVPVQAARQGHPHPAARDDRGSGEDIRRYGQCSKSKVHILEFFFTTRPVFSFLGCICRVADFGNLR